MIDAQRVTTVASALASPARAAMVCALLGGTAHTGRELARHVGVAPSTASEHLARLLAAGLVAVAAQGRHRYYRLAGPEVADLVEALTVVPADATPPPTPAVPAGLAFARSCYDHIAGVLGVLLHDRLLALGAIATTVDGPAVTTAGWALLTDLGVDGSGLYGADIDGADRAGRRPLVRQCLDWSQRRHHIAGAVGAGLLRAMTARRWLYRAPNHPRELRLTPAGRDGLRTHLEIELP